MWRYAIIVFLYCLGASQSVFANDRPPDDLSGRWIGQLDCQGEAEAPRNYQEAKLEFIPEKNGWNAEFFFRKRSSQLPFSHLNFHVKPKIKNKIAYSELRISEVKWNSNPRNYSIPSIDIYRISREGIEIIEIKISDIELKCFSAADMNYVSGSAETILNGAGTPIKERTIDEASLARIKSVCESIENFSELGKCILLSERIELEDSSFNYFSRKYIESVIDRSFSNFKSGKCFDDIYNINSFIADLEKYGFKVLSRPENCDEIADLYKSISGVEDNYIICSSYDEYSREYFLECMNRLWSVTGKQKAAKIYSDLMGTRKPKGMSTARLWDAAHNPNQFVNMIETSLRDNIRECNLGNKLRSQPTSLLSDAFADALTGDKLNSNLKDANWKKIRDSVTCSDVATFLVGTKFIQEEEVRSLLSITSELDLCSPERLRTAPTHPEIESTTALYALDKFCTKDSFEFFVNTMSAYADFTVDGEICRMAVLGLPIAKLSYQYLPSSCKNTGLGHAECVGEISMYCSAEDSSRNTIDCLGKNVSMAARVDYLYDSKACKWIANSIDEDVKSTKVIEGLR